MPTDSPTDADVGLRAFRVERYGHELLVNGEALGGFDIPPSDGWQFWQDVLTDAELAQGTNTLQVVRDSQTDDDFAVNNVTVHRREPLAASGDRGDS